MTAKPPQNALHATSAPICTEMGTAFTVSALYNLINNRLMAKRPMIINTNLLPETLSEKYSPAVASRLLGEFLPLRFFGDDIRLLKMRRT